MKKIAKALGLTCLFFTLIASNCKKDKSSLEQLPLETKEGKGTFGCLVNGKVFKPKSNGPFGSPVLSCTYLLLNSNLSQGYFFGLDASNEQGDCKLTSISIAADSAAVEEGKIFILEQQKNGNAVGQYLTFPSCGIFTEYITTQTIKGELRITKFDTDNQIVSGTFWFDAADKTGGLVHVTEGRFDMKYTR